MKKNIFVVSLIAVISFVGCYSDKEKTMTNNELIGDWSFIYEDSIYSEAYIRQDSISFMSESDNETGPFYYQIRNDSLFYLNNSFRISICNCNSIKLSSNKYTFVLDKIDLDNVIKDYSCVNPFYLRRCNYLVI